MFEDKIEITDIKIADAPSVFALANDEKLSFWSIEDYRQEFGRKDAFAKAAKIDEKIIGFIIARLITTDLHRHSNSNFGIEIEPVDNNNLSKSSVEAEIYNLAVEAAFQGLGIGTLLLKSLFKHILAVANVRATVWLEVRESNGRAVKFYKSNGFEEIYKRKNFYKLPAEDALVLRAEFED